MFICDMVHVLQCAGKWHINTRLESGPVTADLTTTVVHRYKFRCQTVLNIRVCVEFNMLNSVLYILKLIWKTVY